MMVPNKTVSYSASLLPKLPHIVEAVKGNNVISVLELFRITNEDYADISQFVMALETLFALRRIDMINGEIIDVT